MDEFVIRWFDFYSQIYLLHWQTTSYAQHKAFGEINEGLSPLVDAFVEGYQGKYGRVEVGESNPIVLSDIGSVDDIPGLVTDYRDFLDQEIRSMAEQDNDNDLTALLDEMVALLSKLLYLLTLD